MRCSLLARREGVKMYLPAEISKMVKNYVVPINLSAKTELENFRKLEFVQEGFSDKMDSLVLKSFTLY